MILIGIFLEILIIENFKFLSKIFAPWLPPTTSIVNILFLLGLVFILYKDLLINGLIITFFFLNASICSKKIS